MYRLNLNVDDHIKTIRESIEAKRELDKMLSSDFFMDTKADKVNLLTSDMIENEKEFIINCEVPGIKKEDISILFENSFLKIEAKVNEEVEKEEERFIFREIKKGNFKRFFKFRVEINPQDIEAKHENGILTIKIPKAERKSKEISIKIK